MIPSLTSLLSTVAGKVAAGVVVATTSVGAAAAAGAPVPFTAPPEDRPPVEIAAPPADDEEPAAEEPAVEEPAVEEPADDEEPAAEEPAVEEPAVEDEELPDDGSEDDEQAGPRHGDVVSQFATTTANELAGCERGQAVAAVARGDIEPGPEGTIELEAVEAYLAVYLAETGTCDASDEDEVDGDADEDADDASEEGPTHGDVVSGFVTSTELQGCLKGQATAAVARGDVEPVDGVVMDEMVLAHLDGTDVCANAGDDEMNDEEATDDEGAEEGRPDDAGKPDHAGKPAGRGPNG